MMHELKATIKHFYWAIKPFLALENYKSNVYRPVSHLNQLGLQPKYLDLVVFIHLLSIPAAHVIHQIPFHVRSAAVDPIILPTQQKTRSNLEYSC